MKLNKSERIKRLMAKVYEDLFMEVVSEARYGNFEPASELGLECKQIKLLQKLKPEELRHVSSRLALEMIGESGFSLNAGKLTNLLNSTINNTQNTQLIEEFILHGASNQVMNQMFGLTSVQVANLVRLLGVVKTKGRKAKISEKEQDDIYYAYLNALKIHDERLRLLVVAKETGQTIHNIRTTIDEVEEFAPGVIQQKFEEMQNIA